MQKLSSRLLRFISQLFKSVWLFFPGLIFLLLPIFCFWMLGQGKDIVIAFIDYDHAKNFLHFNYTRSIFFLVIGFWAYVSWYSARIVAYIKRRQENNIVKEIAGAQSDKLLPTTPDDKPFDEIGQRFLDEFPRMIGNACFLILELAVLQLPVLSFAISSTTAWIIFILGLLLLRFLNHRIHTTVSTKPSFRKFFWILLLLLIASILVASFIGEIDILILLFLLLLFHAVFICYTNLRRAQMEKKAVAVALMVSQQQQRDTLEKVMDYFCIPRKEKGYFLWFIYISLAAIVLYLVNIFSLRFARHIGPFPTVILAFAVLLAFGNVVTSFSVRSKVNFHFILFLLAFIIGGLHETHYVRTNEVASHDNNYASRPRLKEYLTKWLLQRKVVHDSSANGYDIYFVMANGGASRSGYWTSSVLSSIQDASVAANSDSAGKFRNRFSDHVFCLSGTSGGGVGVATFFSLLRDKSNQRDVYRRSAQAFLKQDYFTYTFARMLGPDFFNYVIPFSARIDRAAALERSFESSARYHNDSVLEVPFYDNFSTFPALKGDSVNLPVLCINTTRMQDGNPGVVTNLMLDSATFNNRVDVIKLLPVDLDISLTSAAILGARFPYLSPAGRIGDNYFVDGGYFDNSGAGVVQEMIRGIINIGKQDSIENGSASPVYQAVRRLHFKVLHITNSPVILDSNNIKSEAPIKNDLLSPVLTILGAYDMQTTVNDVRLINFIKDINSYTQNRADYTQVPLYEDGPEWEQDSLSKTGKIEPSYAMNWFMSDTTLRRINNRVLSSPQLRNFTTRFIMENSGGK
jgi:Patatin-like phospholipase